MNTTSNWYLVPVQLYLVHTFYTSNGGRSWIGVTTWYESRCTIYIEYNEKLYVRIKNAIGRNDDRADPQANRKVLIPKSSRQQKGEGPF